MEIRLDDIESNRIVRDIENSFCFKRVDTEYKPTVVKGQFFNNLLLVLIK